MLSQASGTFLLCVHWSVWCWIFKGVCSHTNSSDTDCVLQFSSVLTLTIQLLHTPQVKGKVLYKTFRTSDACLGGHLYFWPTGCRLGGSHDPIRLGNSLEPLTESSTVNGFIIKAIDEDQPNEETHRAKSVGENAELLCPHGIQVCHHLSTSLCHQPGSSSEPQCPEFLSGFQSIGMIDSLATWLNSISSCPLIPRGWMAESSNPLIMCLVFWMTVSQPEGI